MRIGLGLVALCGIACGNAKDPVPSPPVSPSLVAVTADAITVRGRRVARVHDGAIDPTDRADGDPNALELPKLREAFRAAKIDLARTPRVAITLDPATRYATLVAIIDSLSKEQVHQISLATPGHEHEAIGVDLPEVKPITASADRPAPVDPTLRLVVMLTANELKLFSISELEGTFQAPKLVAPKAGGYDLTALRGALRAIVDARWGAHPASRSDENRRIIIMAESDLPMRELLPVVLATRASPDGTPLFPDTVFSAGVE